MEHTAPGLDEVLQKLNALENRVAGFHQVLENVDAALRNEDAVLRGDLQQQLAGLSNDVATGLQRAAQHAATTEVDLRELRGDLTRTLLGQRRVLCDLLGPPPGPGDVDLTPSPHAPDMEGSCRELRARAPAAYEHWRRLLDASVAAYAQCPADSCSVEGHAAATLFGDFLRPYLRGTVLDVGCGTQPLPAYLIGHPEDLVAGIDPLRPDRPHPFVFAHGVAEFLPWPDSTFDLVIAATSLDHVLLIDRALDEAHRVLRPGGHLAVWVGFVEGSEPFDPLASEIKPADEHHLFHFDRPWFEQLLQERFVPVERLPEPSGSSFYTFGCRT